jgi:hypothetical protein
VAGEKKEYPMNNESDREMRHEALDDDERARRDDSSTLGDSESHATTGGAAAAGAVTGGVIGLTGGPVGAAIGAVGGAIVGAAAERMMHSDDGDRPASPGSTSAETPPTRAGSIDTTPSERHAAERPPAEVEQPVGEPMAEVEPDEPRPPA